MTLRSRLVAIVLPLTCVPVALAAAGSASGTPVAPDVVTVTQAPLPSDAASPASADLLSVSCPAAGVCFAVGSYQRQAGGRFPLGEQLSNGTWTAAALAVQPGADGQAPGQLDVISCASPSFCAAIGQHTDGAGRAQFAQTWNGSSWTVRKLPFPADGTKKGWVRDVSCGADGSCVAVGLYRPKHTSNKVNAPLLLTFDGRAWSAVRGPMPGRDTSGGLGGVSCTSAVDCVAVGGSGSTGTGQRPLAITRSASGWTAATLPLPSSASSVPNAPLNEVACASTGSCEAVGAVTVGAGDHSAGLTERLSAGTWTASAATPPDSSFVSTTLDTVDCGTTTACLAAGSYTAPSSDHATPFVAIVQGSTVTTRAVPASVTAFEINGVACVPSGSCLAVGVDFGLDSFLLRQTGTTLTTQTAPTLPGASDTLLFAVDTDSASTATAVGTATLSSGAQPGLLDTGLSVP